ncbi:MAG: alkaline phosphatase family protein, partial [Acidimicrobiales bacterium]
CGAARADVHWPPDGQLPDGIPRGLAGYAADRAVVDAVATLPLAEADFVFVQIDEVDGVRHAFGASSGEAADQCRRTDAALGEVLDLLAERWDDTVVFAVSDHDQEDVADEAPIDLNAHVPGGAEVQNQGTAALVVGAIDIAALRSVEGVEGVERLTHDHHVVWGGPGRTFGSAPSGLAGDHGSPRTRTQVAVVGGGHPRVVELAAAVGSERPAATSWASRAAELIGLRWRPGASVDVTAS